jgi:hypothetical protein
MTKAEEAGIKNAVSIVGTGFDGRNVSNIGQLVSDSAIASDMNSSSSTLNSYGYGDIIPYQVKFFKDLDPALLTQLKKVYSRIPVNERNSVKYLKKTVENSSKGKEEDPYILVAAEYNGEILGVGSGSWFKNENAGFMSSLSTVQRLEKNGVGTKVRNNLVDMFSNYSKHNGKNLNTVVGELDLGNENYINKMKKREDISFLAIDYAQSAFEKLEGGVPLNVYFQVLDENKLYKGKPLFKKVNITDGEGQEVSRFAVRKEYVEQVITKIFDKIYHTKDSPELIVAMSSIEMHGEYVMPRMPTYVPNCETCSKLKSYNKN